MFNNITTTDFICVLTYTKYELVYDKYYNVL